MKEEAMQVPTYKSALIVGAGEGLSASLTRLLRKEGLAVAIAARNSAKLARLCAETGAQAFSCDAQDEAQVRPVVCRDRRRFRTGGRSHLQRQCAHARALR
jgi:NADP-dependent 3-hydroxy acid dehydrogenase YdfG